MDSKLVKKILAIGGLAGAILAIIGLYQKFVPPVPSQGVDISEVRVQPSEIANSSDGCQTEMVVSFKIRIDGYKGQPLKLYAKVDDSAASPLPVAGLPCPQPLGTVDGWQQVQQITATVQTQSLQVSFPFTVYFRRANRTIQLKVTDANEHGLDEAVTPVFGSKQ